MAERISIQRVEGTKGVFVVTNPPNGQQALTISEITKVLTKPAPPSKQSDK
ncbi:MAG: hypothetical protein WAW06_01110 [bacterium]